MKSLIISLRQNRPIAIAKVVLVLTCLIGLSILMTGCASPGNDNTDNNNNQDPVLLPMAKVSVNDAGEQTNDQSYRSSMSSDGNLIVFYSKATNLVAEDTKSNLDVFVYDRKANKVKLVSHAADLSGSNGDSSQPVISADGRFIAYMSSASNLAATLDNNNRTDIYVFDMAKNENTRISVNAQGEQALLGNSTNPVISADGRFVAFESNEPTLVPDDKNGLKDIFVVDRQANTIERVSVSSTGEANGKSYIPAISADGNFVAFYSQANNLAGDDNNSFEDVFVYNRQNKTIELITPGTGSANNNNEDAVFHTLSISTDGRFVTFESAANDLVAGDTNNVSDIFVFDRQEIIMERVSLSDTDKQVYAPSAMPRISADGRYVAYQSAAILVGGDNNGAADIFLRDRQNKTTKLVSVTSDDKLANKESTDAFISADGHYLSFQSEATNMFPDDTNGVFDIFVIPVK